MYNFITRRIRIRFVSPAPKISNLFRRHLYYIDSETFFIDSKMHVRCNRTIVRATKNYIACLPDDFRYFRNVGTTRKT